MGWDDDIDVVRAAWHTAADSADRFRDVLTQVFGLDENPGDDALIARLLADYNKAGEPESHVWRDRCAGYLAQIDQINAELRGGDG